MVLLVTCSIRWEFVLYLESEYILYNNARANGARLALPMEMSQWICSFTPVEIVMIEWSAFAKRVLCVRSCTEYYTCTNYFSQQPYEVGAVIKLILLMRKLRVCRVAQLFLGFFLQPVAHVYDVPHIIRARYRQWSGTEFF